MKSFYRAGVIACVLAITLTACETRSEKEERLAKQYCSSCHLFPDPALLDKTTWEKSVLPQMAFRMGVDFALLSTIKPGDQIAVLKTLPNQPMVSNEEWEAIKNYFIKNAPDSLQQPKLENEALLKQFEVTKFRFPVNTFPAISMIKADTVEKLIYVANRFSLVHKMDFSFQVKDSFQLHSPASAMILPEKGKPLIITVGIMDPNDQALGQFVRLNETSRELTTLIDSIKRPVFLQSVDLNNDKLEDYVICAFGNYTGELAVYQNLGNDKFQKHIISYLPGSRKVIVEDFNDDGYMDVLALLTQGNEQISLFTNTGNFKFRITTLLRFPSVYGSSYMDIADFNKDGHFDIVYTNGDNADFSVIFKPYHGVRLFMNDGHNQFKEKWFYPIYGASKTVTKDFDLDNDIDIAAISFFPDMANHPERGFIYFENTGDGFKPYTTPLGSSGRWLVMESADLDKDGDTDLMLGALHFGPPPNDTLKQQWMRDRTSILILKNNKFQ